MEGFPLKPLETVQFNTKKQMYDFMAVRMNAYLEEDQDWCAALGNAAALFNALLEDINWVGFYLSKEDDLILGPFQGKPACVRIPFGKGVCGTAASTQMTLCVPNVHEFEGHIACDSASNSELVVPIVAEGRTVGVIDIDSPVFNRFNDEDVLGFEKLSGILASALDWKRIASR
jgi:GAF domain-containing protein